jgi:hypothetical protein
MMIKIVKIILMIAVTIPVMAMRDQDFDGVADEVDRCPKTPFFAKVDAHGCVVKFLTLPSETDSNSLQAVLGYGLITNEDLLGRNEQDISTLKLSYYENSWSYSVGTGYYRYKSDQGAIDTTLSVKKRFLVTPKLRVGAGAGVKLPTYDFQGNKTDYNLYGSLTYYPKKSLSLFTHYTHTFVQDESVFSELQDSQYLSAGAGYFFTNKFYGNFVYTLGENKFASQHAIRRLSTTLYYKLNKEWFSLFSFGQEIDEDIHRTVNLKVGYRIW